MNAHLSAHSHLKETRDSEFQNVVFNLSFDWIPHTLIKSDMYDIRLNKHDVVFWSGDLNYRVEMKFEDALKKLRPKGKKLGDEETVKMTPEKRSLLEYDQLKV